MSVTYNITEEHAKEAAQMILNIVAQAYPEGERPTSTEIRLDRSFGEDMRVLAKKMKTYLPSS